MSSSTDNTELVCDTVLANRCMPFNEVVAHLQSSHGSACEVIHDKHGLLKFCAEWIQTVYRRTNNIVCKLFSTFWTATVNKTHHKEQNMNLPLSARKQMRSLQWKHPTLPNKTKFWTQQAAGKMMFMVLWDSQGLILEPYVERGSTVNSGHY